MPELNELMSEMPADLVDDDAGTDTTIVDDDTEEDQDDDTQDAATDTDTDADDDAEEEDGDTDGDKTGVDDEEDDYVIDAADEADNPPNPQAAADQNALDVTKTSKQEYVLSKLNQVQVNIVVTGQDGKDKTQAVKVYGWQQLWAIPGYKGMASEIDRDRMTQAASLNETKAEKYEAEYDRTKVQHDGDMYVRTENRAIARDLQSLRKEERFPKFKGVPGSQEFANSPGGKMFDEVIAFMDQENQAGGQAATRGEQFTHISFRQAYRMLHPEVFNDKKKAEARNNDRNMARKVKTGGGTKAGAKNAGVKRVGNITDLAEEFITTVGSGK